MGLDFDICVMERNLLIINFMSFCRPLVTFSVYFTHIFDSNVPNSLQKLFQTLSSHF